MMRASLGQISVFDARLIEQISAYDARLLRADKCV